MSAWLDELVGKQVRIATSDNHKGCGALGILQKSGDTYFVYHCRERDGHKFEMSIFIKPDQLAWAGDFREHDGGRSVRIELGKHDNYREEWYLPLKIREMRHEYAVFIDNWRQHEYRRNLEALVG